MSYLGWICYAEKTHGDYILPLISKTRSPQAIMGMLLKHAFCISQGIAPESIYHCTLMPCYDKKLEAARPDFIVPGTTDLQEVCAITQFVSRSFLFMYPLLINNLLYLWTWFFDFHWVSQMMQLLYQNF